MNLSKKITKAIIGSIVVSIAEDTVVYKCPTTSNELAILKPSINNQWVGCIMVTDKTDYRFIEIYYEKKERVIQDVLGLLFDNIKFNGYLFTKVDSAKFKIKKIK